MVDLLTFIEPFYDASAEELRAPASPGLRRFLCNIAFDMSQLLSLSGRAYFPAPGEPRPPAVGEECCHVLNETGDPARQRPPVTMETADDAEPDPVKLRSGWDGGGGGGAEGGCSPSYTAASTPPYLRWAGGLRSLLNDKEGVEHFKTYLKEEHCPEMLNFWFACEGLKHQSPDQTDHDPAQFRRLVIAMYKRFVRPRRPGRASEREPADLPLSELVRTEIAERIKSERLDGRVFDEAQAEVEAQMNRTVYPNFLKSDYYIQIVQGSPRGQDNAEESLEGSSCASSVCGGPPPPAGLPTVHEESEPVPQGAPVALTRGALLATQDKRALIQPTGRRKPDKGPGGVAVRPGLYQQPGLPLQGPVNPYHTLYSSYNPVSRQDSELQSMSSEALTDDTCSRTGSSLDGRRGQYPTCLSQKRMMKRQHRLMKDSARQNQEALLQHTVIPRTQRPTVPDHVDPTRHCAEFARLLSSKLERVIIERELLEGGVDSRRLLRDAIGKLGHLAVENEQEILDAHISKVFDSSHQTPLRSGARSPAVAGGGGLSRRPPPRPPTGGGHRSRDRDVLSTFSADSGTGHDLAGSQLSLERPPRAPAPGAGPGHHQQMPKSRTFPDHGLAGADSAPHRSGRDLTRRSRQSLQDPDSGVSVVSADMLPPLLTRPADKVLLWMQQQQTDKEEMGRHRARSAHAAAAGAGAGVGRRQPPPPYNTSRSGSLDRAPPEEAPRGRSRLSDMQAPPSGTYNSLKRHAARPPKPSQARPDPPEEMLCIAYTFCGEEVPYMTRVAARSITLKQFKQLMPKKGSYRYFFKTECRDFETGVIQEEVTDDSAALPLWEGKVHGQVMTRD